MEGLKDKVDGIQAKVAEQASQLVPSEYKVSSQWESCAGNTLTQFTVGAAIGLGLAMVLAPRRPVLRASFVSLAAGVGIGRGWQQCANGFEAMASASAARGAGGAGEAPEPTADTSS